MKRNYYPTAFDTSRYQLSISHTESTFILKGKITSGPLSTKYLPKTILFLKQYVPSIFECMCFNENNLPFAQELQHTEVAHLLEHILLEFLCEEKLLFGATNAVFDGVTRWYKDSPEKFEILISKDSFDHKYFAKALQKSLSVFDLIINSYQPFSSRVDSFPETVQYPYLINSPYANSSELSA